MDSKRNADPVFIQNRAGEIMDSIIASDPDILMVSDYTARKILNGSGPAEFPITRNQQTTT